MAVSPALVNQIVDWFLRGRQGPPPAGATTAPPALAPPAAPTQPPPAPAPTGAPGPAGTEQGPPGRQLKDLPYPEPKDLKEQAYNQLKRLQWQLEDADAAIAKAKGDPSSP